MSLAEVLDFAHALWAEDVGVRDLDRFLDDAGKPLDEGAEAQARLDAMLAT